MIFDKLFGQKKKDLEIMPSYVCKSCGKEISYNSLKENSFICPDCNKYFRMNAKQRVSSICDKDTFREIDKDMKSKDVLSFPDYKQKLEAAKAASGQNDAVVCGQAKIDGMSCCMFVMDSTFMMGSMGSVVGEKITRLFELARKLKLPVIGFTTSGGARMQEGIYSLMQMAKVSAAVRRHSDDHLLYICVLTDPTTGGITASFAMEGDITIAEPNALVGFAGKRVIKQTTGAELPPGFQSAEFLQECGFVDIIEKRENLKYTISKLLSLHGGK